MNLNIKTQQSIDALMNELKQVVEVAEDDRIDILDYILAELPAVMNRRK